MGDAIKALVSIVKPETFMRWINKASKKKATTKKSEPARKPDRPKTLDEVREWILKMAGETGWSFTRIKFQLDPLGIKSRGAPSSLY